MMSDMEKIRGEWQHALQEKEFELKRSESEAARADRLLEDYKSHSTNRVHELRQEHF